MIDEEVYRFYTRIQSFEDDFNLCTTRRMELKFGLDSFGDQYKRVKSRYPPWRVSKYVDKWYDPDYEEKWYYRRMRKHIVMDLFFGDDLEPEAEAYDAQWKAFGFDFE